MGSPHDATLAVAGEAHAGHHRGHRLHPGGSDHAVRAAADHTVTWTFTDMSQTTQGIPAWAIVLAIVFFLFCLLGLLFLLVKESRTVGSVQVTVQGHRFLHQVQLPVSSMAQVADYNARVTYARSLSAAFN